MHAKAEKVVEQIMGCLGIRTIAELVSVIDLAYDKAGATCTLATFAIELAHESPAWLSYQIAEDKIRESRHRREKAVDDEMRAARKLTEEAEVREDKMAEVIAAEIEIEEAAVPEKDPEEAAVEVEPIPDIYAEIQDGVYADESEDPFQRQQSQYV
jgi:hypothetical protein